MFGFIIRNRIKGLCLKERTRVYRELNDLQSLLVIFDSGEYEYADSFIEKLKKMGKKVTGCLYTSAKNRKEGDIKTAYKVIVPRKDTNWIGVPNESVINDLNQEKYDVVIDLTITENHTLEYILAALDSPLKIGLKKNELPLYDLSIIKLPDSKDKRDIAVLQLEEQLMHYLNIIKTGRANNL